jgi:hypothetical protein
VPASSAAVRKLAVLPVIPFYKILLTVSRHYRHQAHSLQRAHHLRHPRRLMALALRQPRVGTTEAFQLP